MHPHFADHITGSARYLTWVWKGGFLHLGTVDWGHSGKENLSIPGVKSGAYFSCLLFSKI